MLEKILEKTRYYFFKDLYCKYRVLRKYGTITCPKLIKDFPQKNVLVIAPHFDDETIGCGGAICHHIENNANVTIVFLTDSKLGEPKIPEGGDMNALRPEEARRALGHLGVLDMVCLNAPEQELVIPQQLVEGVRKTIIQRRPEVIYLPCIFENHFDHVMANKVLAKAARGLKNDFRCRGYGVWSPFLPNVMIDITGHVDKKRKALLEYQTQLGCIDYERTTLAQNAASTMYHMAGKGYAEAFLELDKKEYLDLIDNDNMLQKE